MIPRLRHALRSVGGPLARVALLLVLLSGSGWAQGADLGVTLIPPDGEDAVSYFRYGLEPGQSRVDRVLVRNGAAEPRRVRIYPADATSTPDGGLVGPTQDVAPSAVGTWVQVSQEELQLEPGEQGEFRITFTVPPDAPPGDHFGFVFVQAVDDTVQPVAQTGQASFSVRMRTRLGITLWERVPGEIRSALVVQPPRKAIEEGRLALEVRLRNEGNVFLKPSAAWQLTGPTGERVLGQELSPLGYVLPGQELVLRLPLSTDVPLVLGAYRLSLQVQDAGGDPRAHEFDLSLP